MRAEIIARNYAEVLVSLARKANGRVDGFVVEAQISGYQHENRDSFARELLDRGQFLYPKGSVFDGLREMRYTLLKRKKNIPYKYKNNCCKGHKDNPDNIKNIL